MISAMVPAAATRRVVRGLEKAGFKWIVQAKGAAAPGRRAMDLLWLAVRDGETETAIRVAMEALGAEKGRGRLLVSPVLESWSLPAGMEDG